jgi:hypothetical protein
MEAKVLTAVFASLAAIFAGLNGGAFSAQDVRDVGSETPGINTPSTSFGQYLPFVGDYFQRPEPENEVKAQIVVGEDSSVSLRKAGVKAVKLTKVDSRSMQIDSNEDIYFRRFSGDLNFGNQTSIKGSTSGLETSGVNITTGIDLATEFDTNRIDVENTQKTNMKFSSASIRPANSDFPIDDSGTDVNVKSFTGDITIHTSNRTLIIDGKVHRIEAGKTSFGS